MLASRPPQSAFMSGLSARVFATTFSTSPSAAIAGTANAASAAQIVRAETAFSMVEHPRVTLEFT